MELFDHFRRPYLNADNVDALEDNILLRQDGRRLELAIGGEIDDATSFFDSLRDPNSKTWAEIRESSEAAGDLMVLLDDLNRLGWLSDADEKSKEQSADFLKDLNLLASKASAWVFEGLQYQASDPSAYDSKKYELQIRSYAEYAETVWQKRCEGKLEIFEDASEEEIDIADRSLRLLLKSWSRTSPMALALVSHILSQSVRLIEGNSIMDFDPDFCNAGVAFTDHIEVRNQVWTGMVLLLLSSTGKWKAAYTKYIPETVLEGPAINILVKAESCAEKLVLNFEKSTIVDAILNSERPKRLGAIIYLNQYYVTIRYVDSILTFLRCRVKKSLRDLGFRYLFEELGHEDHEEQSCISLGIDKVEVAEFAPFPFFLAYPEILGYFAVSNPLSFLLSITVAEGMPGTKKPISGALQEKGLVNQDLAAHEKIDLDLDHERYTRMFMKELGWINNELGKKAISDFLFIVELTQLGWVQIVKFAEESDISPTAEPFSVHPKDILKVWG